jgi:hypothetical protein
MASFMKDSVASAERGEEEGVGSATTPATYRTFTRNKPTYGLGYVAGRRLTEVGLRAGVAHRRTG